MRLCKARWTLCEMARLGFSGQITGKPFEHFIVVARRGQTEIARFIDLAKAKAWLSQQEAR